MLVTVQLAHPWTDPITGNAYLPLDVVSLPHLQARGLIMAGYATTTNGEPTPPSDWMPQYVLDDELAAALAGYQPVSPDDPYVHETDLAAALAGYQPTSPTDPYVKNSQLTARIFTRTTVTHTTASLPAAGRSESTIALPAGYRLYDISTNRPARVRLYDTVAHQATDSARAVGVDPATDSGVLLDYVTTPALLTASLSPLVDGWDGNGDGQVPITVDNRDTATGTVTVTFTYVRTE